MSSRCHNLKQEYEDLKAMKKKFVSACEKAKASVGSFDALSRQQLNDLKKAKRSLEEARDVLKNKIESASKRMWDGILHAANATIIEDGKYEGKSIEEVLASPEFQERFNDALICNEENGRIDHAEASTSVVGLHAAAILGWVPDKIRNMARIFINSNHFRSVFFNDVVYRVNDSRRDGSQSVLAAHSVHSAFALGCLSEVEKKDCQKIMQVEKFKRIFRDCLNTEIQNGHDLDTEFIANGLLAAFSLDLLLDDDKRRVQQCTESERFKESFVQFILGNVKSAEDDSKFAWLAVVGLATIKELIAFYRKHPQL